MVVRDPKTMMIVEAGSTFDREAACDAIQDKKIVGERTGREARSRTRILTKVREHREIVEGSSRLSLARDQNNPHKISSTVNKQHKQQSQGETSIRILVL